MSVFSSKKVKKYPSMANEVKFLLGGIGTGNISIGSRGQMTDFEIFNEPSKGRRMPYTFFSMWSKAEGEQADARILEARLNPPYERALGYFANELAGLPRFEKGEISAAYPFVKVALQDKKLPLQVTMDAFTPFIPLNADDSGIPGAYITYTVENTGDKPYDVSICGSFTNPVAFGGMSRLSELCTIPTVSVTNIAKGTECEESVFFPKTICRKIRGITGIWHSFPRKKTYIYAQSGTMAVGGIARTNFGTIFPRMEN